MSMTTSTKSTSITPSASVDAFHQFPQGICALTHQVLDVQHIIQSVEDHAAGATAVFIGTTRNSFKGQVVTRLEYQAYSKMAIKTMSDIIIAANSVVARSDHASPSTPASPLLHCSVYHRLGTVPVGEASIVIAVASPHRKEAFVACEYILEQVKLKAPIWKQEIYESGEPAWKANASS